MTPNNTWKIEIPGKPRLLNQSRGARHWSINAEATANDRAIGKLLAKQAKIPKLNKAIISVFHHVNKANRGRRPDQLSCVPTVKSAIDGIVDAGVLDDDGPTQLMDVHFFPVCLCDKDSVEILIMEG